MFRIATAALMGMVFLLASGCEPKSPPDGTSEATSPAAAPKDHPDDGHDHAEGIKGDDHADDHGHDHGPADHDDDDGHKHGHGGQRHVLGSREVAGLTVEVAQFGAASDNAADLVFEIDAPGEPAPTAIRLFVRAADGAESLKVKADKSGDHDYHAHVGELPGQLGEGSVLVVELETASGAEELIFPLNI